eukprot:scaffold19493_cov42-Cyclotella_meneghiniana.AAC.2
MIVGNQKFQFSRLTLKRIGVELGTAAQGHFEAVGIIIVSIPENPTEVILLYPSYYSPTDKCPTISTGVLKSSTYFTDVIHHANNKLVLLPSSNSTPLSLPCTVIDGIDFISLRFHTIHNSSSQQKCNNNSIKPKIAKSSVNNPSRQFRFKSLQPLSISDKQLPGTTLFSALLHQYYGHRSLSLLQQMVDKGYITGPGLPCKLAPLLGRCPICDAARMTKVPRVKLKDHSIVPIGVRYHVDYAFWNTESIRGFNATLIIVEATTRYIWLFHSRSRGVLLGFKALSGMCNLYVH